MTFGFIECILIAVAYMFVGYVTAMAQKRRAEFESERDPHWLACVWVMWPCVWLMFIIYRATCVLVWLFEKMGRLVK